MQHLYSSNEMIEQLVAIQTARSSELNAEMLRRTLRALVELAKSEQLLQMRRDVANAAGLLKRGE
jgi:ribosomal protein L17